MGEVVGIYGQRPTKLGEPSEQLITVLEDALARAKSGELQSFIGTGFTSGGMRLALWCDLHEDVYQMLGSLAWLQHEYVHKKT